MTCYLYDEAGQLLGEYNASGVPVYETIYLGNMPVGVLKQTGTAATSDIAVTVYNVYADHIATPRIITRQDQQIVWRWDTAEAFGATMPEQNPGSLGIFTYNQRFPGQVFDAETGLFQNWNREYNARQGRYIQSDPIGLEGGINTFAYVEGDPLSLVDPTGEIPWWAVVGGFANGGIAGFQKYQDPCADWRDVTFAFGGGFVSGFFSTLIPITGPTSLTTGFIGGAVARGAAAGYLGSQAGNWVSNAGSTSGLAGNHNSAVTSAFFGGIFGGLGNAAGLFTALSNVRNGFTGTAMATGNRVGTGVGALGGVFDAGTQSSGTKSGESCTCKR